jgi:hypothetical protein
MPSITPMMSLMRSELAWMRAWSAPPAALPPPWLATSAASRQLAGLAGTVGILLHGRTQFFHGSGGLLQRAGLLLGTLAQVSIAWAIWALAVATLSDCCARRPPPQLRRHGLHRHEAARDLIALPLPRHAGSGHRPLPPRSTHRFRQ